MKTRQKSGFFDACFRALTALKSLESKISYRFESGQRHQKTPLSGCFFLSKFVLYFETTNVEKVSNQIKAFFKKVFNSNPQRRIMLFQMEKRKV